MEKTHPVIACTLRLHAAFMSSRMGETHDRGGQSLCIPSCAVRLRQAVTVGWLYVMLDLIGPVHVSPKQVVLLLPNPPVHCRSRSLRIYAISTMLQSNRLAEELRPVYSLQVLFGDYFGYPRPAQIIYDACCDV